MKVALWVFNKVATKNWLKKFDLQSLNFVTKNYYFKKDETFSTTSNLRPNKVVTENKTISWKNWFSGNQRSDEDKSKTMLNRTVTKERGILRPNIYVVSFQWWESWDSLG